ncbi:MAG: hypothetical protein U1D35_07935 [Paracoccaceae bacterium]|nr:hypothetical protein [Paracoccaceae bacterium]
MTLNHQIIAAIRAFFRLSVVLAVFLVLNMPHPGMAATALPPMMTMDHASETPGQMNHADGLHDHANGAFCATLCFGTDRFQGAGLAGRLEVVENASWELQADPAWVPAIPDPTLRPPDTLQSA